jgi:hypothetical protein
VVLYHCCMSYERAKEIARIGFDQSGPVRVVETLPAEQARAADESHAVVVLAVPWDFRLQDYPLAEDSDHEHLVPADVLNMFERAVWSV